MIHIAHQLNPKIEIAIRTEDEVTALLLKQEINGKFFFNERELAYGMSRYVLNRSGIKYPFK